MADQNDFRFGDTVHDLLRKILGRLLGVGGGGPGGDVTLTASDIEIGAVELKNAADDTRAVIRPSDPGAGDAGLVVRNIPSGTQATSNAVGSQVNGHSACCCLRCMILIMGHLQHNPLQTWAQ